MSSYPRCCFLSPTSRQTFFIATAVYSLMSVPSCQHTAIIVSLNLQYIQYGHFLVICTYSCINCIRNALLGKSQPVRIRGGTFIWYLFRYAFENKKFVISLIFETPRKITTRNTSERRQLQGHWYSLSLHISLTLEDKTKLTYGTRNMRLYKKLLILGFMQE